MTNRPNNTGPGGPRKERAGAVFAENVLNGTGYKSVRYTHEELADMIERFFNWVTENKNDPAALAKFHVVMKDENKEELLEEAATAIVKAKNEGPIAGYFQTPSSPETFTTYTALAAGRDRMEDLPDTFGLISGGNDWKVTLTGATGKVVYTNREKIIVDLFSNMDLLTGSNTSIKSLFVYFMTLVSKQAVDDEGNLKHPEDPFIIFPIEELIDLHIFGARTNYEKTAGAKEAAKRGLIDACSVLQTIQLNITTRKRKKHPLINEGGNLFYHRQVKNGICRVYINPKVPWGELTKSFTLLPHYYFELSNRAKDLCFYIFYNLRQSLGAIAETGYFTLKGSTIAAYLGLPDPERAEHVRRDIIDPMEAAFEEIEAKQAAYGLEHLEIYPSYDQPGALSSTGYLTGPERKAAYLWVESARFQISGELLDYVKDLNDRNTKKRLAQQRKKERIETEARIRSLEKAMDTERKPDKSL